MRFIIATQEFNFLIAKCLNIIPQKPSVPILVNLLVEAQNGRLTITATDLNVGICCSTEAKILEEGKTAIPGRTLWQLVKELTAANIELKTSENQITEIIANDSLFKLRGLDAKEFPKLPDLTGGDVLVMNQSDLKQAFYRTAFAVSKEDNRYALTGVCMQIQEQQATFLGTDGKRLSRCKVPVLLETPIEGQFIIPLKAVEEMMKNLLEEGEVKLFFFDDKIGLETGDFRLIAKLLAGDYPDVSRVIPEKPEIVVSLHREELMSLLRQIALFASDQNHSVRFTFSPGELRLNANAMEVGEGKVSMLVNYPERKNLEVSFNPAYFLDILRHTKGETVSMGLVDAFNPGAITEEDCSNTTLANPLYIIMPLRI